MKGAIDKFRKVFEDYANAAICLQSGTGKSDKFLKREIEILKWMNHKNVIRVYDLLEGEDQFFIIMELASKGDLLSLLQERRKLPEEEAKVMFKSIIEGVQHCHKKGKNFLKSMRVLVAGEVTMM